MQGLFSNTYSYILLTTVSFKTDTGYLYGKMYNIPLLLIRIFLSPCDLTRSPVALNKLYNATSQNKTVPLRNQFLEKVTGLSD